MCTVISCQKLIFLRSELSVTFAPELSLLVAESSSIFQTNIFNIMDVRGSMPLT